MSIRSLRRWWQIKTGKLETPIDGEVPFWIVSLAFHLMVIVFLARIVMPAIAPRDVNLTMDEPVATVADDDIPLEFDFDDLISEDIGANGDSGFETATDQAPILEIVPEDSFDLEMETHDFGEIVTGNDFFEATADSLSMVAVKGSVGNSVNAASGAVDRLTQEILLSLQERDTTVVWLFDQSASLMRQREEILSRFDRIYKELGIIQASGHQTFDNKTDHPLLTQIYSFGAKTNRLIAEPTDDLSTIKEAIENISRDNTGIENVMTAVITAAKRHEKYRKVDRLTGQPRRNVMLIVVSDESGDDVSRIDETVRICNDFQMPIYVVGVPAPFGRPETQVKWVDPDPEFDQRPQWAIVSQGPESVLAERLRLDFTGTFDDLDMIDSGFGPFHLTRLCYETGGIYFAVHPNRKINRKVNQWETKSYSAHLQYFFDPESMRRYKPDYVSNKTYLKRLKDSGTRQALVQAAAFTTTGTLESPRLRFPKLDEAEFVNSVSRAQRTAAIIEPQINRLYQMLKVGESDRDSEISPRWQAGYDLAMGRTIAAKVRAESYNAMLALIKTKLKFDPPKNADTPQKNTWVLAPADAIETGSQDAKLLDKANMYLNRVVENHPGTPWAMLAQRELTTPIGWKWRQTYTPPPMPRPDQPNNQPRNRNIPQPRTNAMPKQLRPPPRL